MLGNDPQSQSGFRPLLVPTNWARYQYGPQQDDRAPSKLGPRVISNQHGYPADASMPFGQHQGQGITYLYHDPRLAEQRAVEDRRSAQTGSRHRLLQTTPPPDEIEWTGKAANAHGIDPEVMRAIIRTLSADDFEEILFHYRGGRAYRATHRILAAYMQYHMRVPTAEELNMVAKADAPFEEFALKTGPSGCFWADWQTFPTLDDWKLVALAIFIKLGEERARFRTDKSKTNSRKATCSDDEEDGELSDHTLEDTFDRVVPPGQAAHSRGTGLRHGTKRPASGHLSSNEHEERGRNKRQASVDSDYSTDGRTSRLGWHGDDNDKPF